MRVTDTGTGIPKGILERVFEPFFTTKPKGEGSGLGLATVYGIVAQANGFLQIHSELGQGTALTALLPVTDNLAMDRAHPLRQPRLATGETILVVEDEHALREVTQRLLIRNGYHVLVASNGTLAINIATKHPGRIHLLLTDVIMPEMLGKEVAERVTVIRPRTKVLYMSGYAQPILSAQGNLDPGITLLEKPFSESTLIAKVLEVINKPRHP